VLCDQVAHIADGPRALWFKHCAPRFVIDVDVEQLVEPIARVGPQAVAELAGNAFGGVVARRVGDERVIQPFAAREVDERDEHLVARHRPRADFVFIERHHAPPAYAAT
jgi:hypothetical protein